MFTHQSRESSFSWLKMGVKTSGRSVEFYQYIHWYQLNNLKVSCRNNLNSSLSGAARRVIASAIKEWESTLPCRGSWIDVTNKRRSTSYMHFFVGGGYVRTYWTVKLWIDIYFAFCYRTIKSTSDTNKPSIEQISYNLKLCKYFRCYSQVGHVGGAQKVSIGRGCERHGIAVHEIGRCLPKHSYNAV